jgi:hypothetical protein
VTCLSLLYPFLLRLQHGKLPYQVLILALFLRLINPLERLLRYQVPACCCLLSRRNIHLISICYHKEGCNQGLAGLSESIEQHTVDMAFIAQEEVGVKVVYPQDIVSLMCGTTKEL